jgi:NAD(P)H-hydrate epimerase
VDEALMGPQLGFAVEQLMELAGLSVAAALAAEYPPDTHRSARAAAEACVPCGGNPGGRAPAQHAHTCAR